MKITLTLIVFFILSTSNIIASEYWNVRIWKKGKVRISKKSEDFKESDKPCYFNENGFYLYRNCLYFIELENGNHKSIKLVDIKKDTLLLVDFSNNQNKSDDTLKLHFKEIKKIIFTNRHDSFIRRILTIKDYNIEFIKENIERKIESKFEKIHPHNEDLNELIPTINLESIEYYYFYNGFLYYHNGIIKDLVEEQFNYKTKNFFWFTPNYVNEINGLSLGVLTTTFQKKNIYSNSTLKINGINLELNPLGIFGVPMGIIEAGVFFIYFPNDFSEIRESEKNPEYIVNGLNLNYAMFINQGSVNGLNIIGAFSKFNEINGLSISGLSNMTYVFNGLSISGLFNRSLEHNGVQIALINKTNDLRGIQIGLWNINNKRSLPLINWNFSD